MKIRAFNGSPQRERGNTYVMVEAFLEGARRKGAETEHIILANKKIKHCMGCFMCWTKTPGKCVINDDMADLIQQYLTSDIVVIASPLYTDYVTGIMKDFMDRMIPMVLPQFNKAQTSESSHSRRFEKYPAVVLMSNCGFPEQKQFDLLRLYAERRMKNDGEKIIAQIYRSEGELLGRGAKNLLLKPVISRYKKLLEKAGEEITVNMRLSEETQRNRKKLISDMIIIAIGVRPNIELARSAGIKVNKGIIVDRFMQTNIEDIYAAGDVTEAEDLLSGESKPIAIWPVAAEQGKVAGLNMAGGRVEYRGGVAMNSVELCGIPTISVGITSPRDNGYEAIKRIDKDSYKKIVIKDNRVVGFIFIGDIDRAGIYTGLIKDKVDISTFKEHFLKEDFGFISLPESYRKHLVQGPGIEI